MKKIELEALFGNETKKIEITSPDGAGGGYYQVVIDKYYNVKL